MKKQIVVLTPHGPLHGDEQEVTEAQVKEIKDMFKEMMENGVSFYLDSDVDTYFLPKEMIQKSIFILKDIKDESAE